MRLGLVSTGRRRAPRGEARRGCCHRGARSRGARARPESADLPLPNAVASVLIEPTGAAVRAPRATSSNRTKTNVTIDRQGAEWDRSPTLSRGARNRWHVRAIRDPIAGGGGPMAIQCTVAACRLRADRALRPRRRADCRRGIRHGGMARPPRRRGADRLSGWRVIRIPNEGDLGSCRMESEPDASRRFKSRPEVFPLGSEDTS